MDTPRKTLETILAELSSAEFSMLASSSQNLPPRVVVLPRNNMASHGVQYTVDHTERGIVSDHATPQPMQRMALKSNIPAIRAFKDARTARIKSIGEKSQSAFSVGGPANETSMGRGTPFNADWL
ncbi:unannotated protein [freshwater metagenome]|uniref:Unannotated protein n=1 Tax=freshwater metagenome TaxID=449393 RepID=A0A6J6EXZ5_9ZZZZ